MAFGVSALGVTGSSFFSNLTLGAGLGRKLLVDLSFSFTLLSRSNLFFLSSSVSSGSTNSGVGVGVFSLSYLYFLGGALLVATGVGVEVSSISFFSFAGDFSLGDLSFLSAAGFAAAT